MNTVCRQTAACIDRYHLNSPYGLSEQTYCGVSTKLVSEKNFIDFRCLSYTLNITSVVVRCIENQIYWVYNNWNTEGV